MDNLLVVRLSAMGDVIHALPAVSALKQTLPDTKIGWAVEERWSELLCAKGHPLEGPISEQRPLAYRVHHVRTKEWRRGLWAPQSWSSTWRDLQNCLDTIRKIRYDAALDLQGSIRSAVISRWSGASEVVGSSQPREWPARMFYQKKIEPSGTHVIEQNLSFAEKWTGKAIPMPDAVLPRDPVAETWRDNYCAEQNIGKLVLLNPGAGWGAKQWPSKRYGHVARELTADGCTVLVNYGPGEEPLAQSVASSSGGAARPVQCSIGELIALTRRAALFVGGDTGPLHLAAALKIPVVAIFGPTNPARNGPFGTRSIVLRSPESATSHKRRTETESGMLQITEEQVLIATRSLLQGAGA